jgi:hypothetical protein
MGPDSSPIIVARPEVNRRAASILAKSARLQAVEARVDRSQQPPLPGQHIAARSGASQVAAHRLIWLIFVPSIEMPAISPRWLKMNA